MIPNMWIYENNQYDEKDAEWSKSIKQKQRERERREYNNGSTLSSHKKCSCPQIENISNFLLNDLIYLHTSLKKYVLSYH